MKTHRLPPLATLIFGVLLLGGCSDEPASENANKGPVWAGPCALDQPELRWLVAALAVAGALLSGCSDEPAPENSDKGPVWPGPRAADQPELRMVDQTPVKLHVACQGEGKTIVLLHGFPEFWRGWSKVMPLLAKNHRVVVPDQRGYNLSDKPEGLDAYLLDKLAADVEALIDVVSDKPVTLVGHDWGGVVAWYAAFLYPEKVERLVIANGPHPNVFAREYANNPDQKSASGYMTLLQSPTAEAVLSGNDYAFLLGAMGGVLDADETALYKKAWAQEGALTAMLNWYRANMSAIQTSDIEVKVQVPTLVLWGLKDTALLPGNIVGLDKYVSDLKIQRFPSTTHWIAQEQPAAVAKAIGDFVAGLAIPVTATEVQS